MKTVILINKILENFEKLINNIRKLLTDIKKSFKKSKNVTI